MTPHYHPLLLLQRCRKRSRAGESAARLPSSPVQCLAYSPYRAAVATAMRPPSLLPRLPASARRGGGASGRALSGSASTWKRRGLVQMGPSSKAKGDGANRTELDRSLTRLPRALAPLQSLRGWRRSVHASGTAFGASCQCNPLAVRHQQTSCHSQHCNLS